MYTQKNDAVMCDNQMQAQIKRPEYTELWSYNTLNKRKFGRPRYRCDNTQNYNVIFIQSPK